MAKNNSNFKNKNKLFNTTNIKLLGQGKIPPQALDFEEAVLGALMIDKNALNEVIDILEP